MAKKTLERILRKGGCAYLDSYPIPRTLHMFMLGIRDFCSVIEHLRPIGILCKLLYIPIQPLFETLCCGDGSWRQAYYLLAQGQIATERKVSKRVDSRGFDWALFIVWRSPRNTLLCARKTNQDSSVPSCHGRRRSINTID